MGVTVNFTDKFKNIFTYKISDDIEVSPHAHKQMIKRGVSEAEAIETVER
jgi:hypothetical protein